MMAPNTAPETPMAKRSQPVVLHRAAGLQHTPPLCTGSSQQVLTPVDCWDCYNIIEASTMEMAIDYYNATIYSPTCIGIGAWNSTYGLIMISHDHVGEHMGLIHQAKRAQLPRISSQILICTI